ncbi:Cthe_2314 family HEPN domain-containing protein [Marinifilum fragile]|uniref:Cthe_2314 family HEPN domain-containing protein n=1 Tax=Marinifilum fragile TaxID=570161 RepID=UPI002AA65192|nr:Cthe_2314 family HEPN domain-containing protein [Marinifilum fragile]
MNKTINISSEDFKYPSTDERINALKSYPELSYFDFEFQPFSFTILPTDQHKKNHLFWWDKCLRSKLEKLQASYVYTKTHYERGIPEDEENFTNTNYINRTQFDFYIEVFYYYFISTRDILFQIVNIYYDFGLKERGVNYKNLIQEKVNKEVIDLLDKFNKNISDSSEIRNSITHRYPLNHDDCRTEFDDRSEDYIYLTFKTKKAISRLELIEDMNRSLTHLSEFVNQLKKNMKKANL